jgi:hypothetical protein
MMQQQPQGQPQQPQQAQGANPQNQARALLRVDVGDFDVDVTAGKGYQTGRQESVEAITGIVQAFPPLAPKLIPIALKNSDWPGAQEAAALVAPDQQQGMVPVEEAQKAQMVINGLTERLKAIEIPNRSCSQGKADLQSKEAIAQMDNQTKVQIEQLKIQGDLQLAGR